MDLKLHRRTVLSGLGAIWGTCGLAGSVRDLEWSDLLPDPAADQPAMVPGVIDHSGTTPARQPKSSGLRRDWNGQLVRLPGFIIPLETKGTAMTSGILAPFVGACIHVPPPPANQLVLVTTKRPYRGGSLFQSVAVTGLFRAAPISTDLAEIGYSLAAQAIDPYRI